MHYVDGLPPEVLLKLAGVLAYVVFAFLFSGTRVSLLYEAIYYCYCFLINVKVTAALLGPAVDFLVK